MNNIKEYRMKFKILKASLLGSLLSVSAFYANAGLIDSSSVLLDDAGATQLENWYGQGDLDWDSIWYGSTGATSTSWHAAVDGVSDTFSIYDVTYNNTDYLIGGYNSGTWSSLRVYEHYLTSNFIFNLTSNIYHDTTDNYYNGGWEATYNSGLYFAQFGAGADLGGGSVYIGRETSYTNHFGSYNGQASTKGNIIDNGSDRVYYKVNALETFVVREASDVPEPSTLAIFVLGMIGLASRRFKKQS
ncbi:MAG: PEP-CTERM sorting domain-containing protein [Alteromonadaceae bacterium]|nr:PEP-CTERM sorting domain-containing protein [Alteromonadaceae bacterium]